MSRTPAPDDDAAAHAVPPDDAGDDVPIDDLALAPGTPGAPSPARALARALADLHTRETRLALREHRLARLQAALAAAAPPVAPKRKGGHPGHRARNDRLLELYEATPERLPHLQRCRLAATALARELEAAGAPPRRIMPAATARDAIAEAQRHRDAMRVDGK
jgi:hypothetical protein